MRPQRAHRTTDSQPAQRSRLHPSHGYEVPCIERDYNHTENGSKGSLAVLHTKSESQPLLAKNGRGAGDTD